MSSASSQPEIVHSAPLEGEAKSTFLYFPAVRLSKRATIFYAILFLICIIASIAAIDTVKTFFITERALLTVKGRERRRIRRRAYDREKICDETDEPNLFNGGILGWRKLSSCVEYDLSLRRQPLGDKGVKKLVYLLQRKEYATDKRPRRLRVLNLQRQGITRRGAGYLARWLSVEPIEATDKTADLVDVDRMPTAASRSIFINLEGNPIGLLGVKDLERAVDKARINGIRVVIVGGGSSSDRTKGRGQHVVKFGPVEYTRTVIEMPPWRLPVPMMKKINDKIEDHYILPSVKMIVVFGLGVALGRMLAAMNIPYRLVLVRTGMGVGVVDRVVENGR